MDFDIHDPANLAPICSSCNGPAGKGGEDLSNKPVVLSNLRRAERLRPKVVKQVQTFGNSRKTAENLIKANETDLSDPRARRAFEDHAPAIVQKLALLGEEKADFLVLRTIDIEIHDRPLTMGLSLNARGRMALTVLEEVCGCPAARVLEEGTRNLVTHLDRAVQTELEAIEAPAGQSYSGPPENHYLTVEFDSVDFERSDEWLVFTFTGSFEGSFSSSLVQDSSDGYGLDELQGDAEVSGKFEMVGTGELVLGSMQLVEVESCITEWEADAYATP
ncbi:hypothetical protein ACFYP0_18960 [Micromonospora arida]|uniref:hypothetical protein n=1 Tax=Micromonospora arida TaxID=2203715 RepID=UPI0036C19EAE